MTIARLFALLAWLPIAACGSGAAAPAGEGPPPGAAETAPKPAGLQVAADLQRTWGITVGSAARTTATGTVSLPGVLRLDEQHTAQISSLIEGKVVSIAADLGARVRKGQVLATIHAPGFAQAKTAFLLAGAKLEQAQREHERARRLLQQEAIDQKEALRRRTEFESASSEFGVAESHLHSLGLGQADVEALLKRARQPAEGDHMDDLADPYLALTSPIDGRVIERDLITGQHIDPEKTLFTIADLSTLWAVLDARETDLPLLSEGRAVQIRTDVYPGRAWDGRILHVGDIIDEKSRTVKVRVGTPNPGLALKPNMYIQGEIQGAVSSREVLTVPDEAVQTINGDTIVFVRTGPDRFAPRPVEAGGRVAGRRVIARGLDGSEAIVLTGAFNLKAELLKASLAVD